MRRAIRFTTAALAIVALLTSCSSGVETMVGCEQGATQICLCDGGLGGEQVCQTDNAWGPCSCDSALDAFSPDSSASDGTADSSSSDGTVDSSADTAQDPLTNEDADTAAVEDVHDVTEDMVPEPDFVVVSGGTCEEPTLIEALPFNGSGSTADQDDNIRTYGEQCAAQPLTGGDFVFEVEASTGDDFIITVSPSTEYDAAVSVIANCGEGETCLAFSDAYAAEGNELVGFIAEADTSYFIVVDGAESEGSFTISVDEPAPLSLSAVPTSLLCNGDGDGAIDLIVSGGVPPYTYEWSNAATTQDLSGLDGGVFLVTVTDALGESKSLATIVVAEPDVLSASLSSADDVSCNGDGDGAIDILVSGGTVPYSFLWSNGATTEDLSNLAPGTFSVDVTDTNSCTAELDSLTIEQPAPLSVTLETASDTTCHEGADGSADISVSGGTVPYTYYWSNSATTQDITGLAAGTYSVTVADGNSCTGSLADDVAVGQPDAVSVVLDGTTQPTCYGDSDGAADISVSGGTGPYTYLWSNGGTTQDATGLIAGTYSVTVTDNVGCTGELTDIVVAQPAAILVTDVSTNVSCFGGSDGSIDITVTNGTYPYSYLWSSGGTTQDLTDVAADTFSVTVTDTIGCTGALDVEITEPTELSVSLVETSKANCDDDSSWGIDISVSGGTGTYTYDWSNDSTVQDPTGLSADSYSVTVTDGNSCPADLEAIVIADLNVTVDSIVDVTCYGLNNGSIDITVSGGTPPYNFLWDGTPSVEDLANLGANTYDLEVTDADTCSFYIADTTVTQPTALQVALDGVTPVSDHCAADGTASITVSGGTPASEAPFYAYAWSHGATSQDVTGLDGVTYSVTATDENACETSLTDIEVGGDIDLNDDEVPDCRYNLLTNPRLDGDVTGWSGDMAFSYSTTDAFSEAGSGSIEAEQDVDHPDSWTGRHVHQCIPITAGEQLSGFGQYFVPSGQGIDGTVYLWVWLYTTTDCTGGASTRNGPESFVLDSWQYFSVDPFTVPSGRIRAYMMVSVSKESTPDHLHVLFDNLYLGPPGTP